MAQNGAANGDGRLVIDSEADGIFKVSRKAFVSEDVLEQEKRNIFNRCWIYVGHESEIRKNGDFVTRTIADRNLIFNRDRNGDVNVFYNTCTHRGAFVCREKEGNAKRFQCFYHGWVFSDEGELIEVPGRDAYCEHFNDSGDSNLARVERLESYRGLYFVNFGQVPTNLYDYLGGVREYIDLVIDQGEAREGYDSKMEIVGGTQQYAVSANWKLMTENSIDGYHAATTHATYMDYLASTAGSMANVGMSGGGKQLGNGHAAIEYSAPWGRPVAQWVPAWGEQGQKDVDAMKARLTEKFGQERSDRITNMNRNILVFPNLVINDIMAITFRAFYPQEPGKMNVNAWALAPVGETPEFRERRLFNFLEFLGPGGFATPDDVEALEMCQRGYKNMEAVGWNDISKGIQRDEPGTSDELQMRAFWRQWNSLMVQEAAE